MNALFELSAPCWHFVLRASVIYVLVMVLMRVSGKRAVGQFTPFDLILLILIGNAVQNGINGGDNSLTGALIMASLDNGMSMIGVDSFWQMIVKGSILLLAVWIDVVSGAGSER